MNDVAVRTDEAEDVYDTRVAAGIKRIKKHWESLQPQTRKLLVEDGFDDRGSCPLPLESWNMSRDLAYSLGLFEEAVKARIPAKNGDPIPTCYGGDDILHEAANLVLRREYCDPAFTSLALHACIKQQASSAVVSFHYHDGGSKRPGVKAILGMSVTSVVFSIMLAGSIGNGLTLAIQHDGVSASVMAFVGMFSYGVLNNLGKPEAETKWATASSNWSVLTYLDFHIGTGHGVEHQLRQLMRQGVHVPSVLFDLCAALQQGTQYLALRASNPES